MASLYDVSNITFIYFILPLYILGLCLISLIIYLTTRHHAHSTIRYIGFLASGSLIIAIVIYISITMLVWQFEYFIFIFLIIRYFPIFLIGIVFFFQGIYYFKCEKKNKSPTKEDTNFYGIMWIIISIINHFSSVFFIEANTYPGSSTISLGLFIVPLLYIDNYVIVLIILGIYMIANKGT